MSISVTTIEPTIGHLSTYAILVGAAFQRPSIILVDVMPRVDSGLSTLADRVDTWLLSDKHAPLGNSISTPTRLSVDAVLAAIGVKGGTVSSAGDDGDGLGSAMDWDTLQPQGLEHVKVLNAIDAYFGGKSR